MVCDKEIPSLMDFKYKFIISEYDESTGIETRHLCVNVSDNKNAVLFTYKEPRNTNKAILLKGIYSIMNPLTLILLPVGMKGFNNIEVAVDMEFNFIREKEDYLINLFIAQSQII